MVSFPQHRVRVLVFLDYSNFRASMGRTEAGFQIDIVPLGRCLAETALAAVDASAGLDYGGMRLYGSYDPVSQAGNKQRNWYNNFASQVPGISVTAVPRQRKKTGPVCPSCNDEVVRCPDCGSDMRGTEEKGVDTRIATDLISLAWVEQYDVAVLVSSDRDFIPVVQFLDSRALKVVHGAFPPFAAELTSACWASIDVPALRAKFRR